MTSRKIPISPADSAAPQADTDSFEESPQFRIVDRRHFVQGDSGSADSGPVEENPRYPTYVEELMARASDAERRFKEKVAQLDQEAARIKARLEAEGERLIELNRRNLMQPFLEVLDNLERALAAVSGEEQREDLFAGVQMTAALFRSKLKSQSIEPIDVLDQPFDPNICQAVGIVPVRDPDKDGLVVEELLRGYRMGDALLREAHVRVGRYDPNPGGSA